MTNLNKIKGSRKAFAKSFLSILDPNKQINIFLSNLFKKHLPIEIYHSLDELSFLMPVEVKYKKKGEVFYLINSYKSAFLSIHSMLLGWDKRDKETLNHIIDSTFRPSHESILEIINNLDNTIYFIIAYTDGLDNSHARHIKKLFSIKSMYMKMLDINNS